MKNIKNLAIGKTIAILFIFMCVYQTMILRIIPKLIKLTAGYFGMELVSSDLPTSYIMGIVVRLVGVVGIFIILLKLDMIKQMTAKWNWRYLLISTVLIGYTIFNFEYTFISSAKIPLVLIMLIECLMIGAFEEIFYRGLVLGVLLKKWGNSRRGIYAAVILSSFLFGMTHVFNLFTGNAPNVVISQMVYAIFLGVLFAAIYIRCNYCMWWCILLHALFDISDQLIQISGYDKTIEVIKTVTVVSNSDVILNDLLMLPTFLAGLFLLRKVENRI